MRLAAALILVLAGCAQPVAWTRPGADDDRRGLDLAECASLARAELRSHRALAAERPEPDAATIGRDDDTAVRRRLREADAADDRAALIARCMQGKGYAPAGRP